MDGPAALPATAATLAARAAVAAAICRFVERCDPPFPTPEAEAAAGDYRLCNDGIRLLHDRSVRQQRMGGRCARLVRGRAWTRVRVDYPGPSLDGPGARWYRLVEAGLPSVGALFAPVRVEQAERAVCAIWALCHWLPPELARRIARLAVRLGP